MYTINGMYSVKDVLKYSLGIFFKDVPFVTIYTIHKKPTKPNCIMSSRNKLCADIFNIGYSADRKVAYRVAVPNSKSLTFEKRNVSIDA